MTTAGPKGCWPRSSLMFDASCGFCLFILCIILSKCLLHWFSSFANVFVVVFVLYFVLRFSTVMSVENWLRKKKKNLVIKYNIRYSLWSQLLIESIAQNFCQAISCSWLNIKEFCAIIVWCLAVETKMAEMWSHHWHWAIYRMVWQCPI